MDVKAAKEIFSKIIDQRDPGIAIGYWDGSTQRLGGGELQVTLYIKDPKVVEEIFNEPSLGFGTAYMSGRIDIEGDLGTLLAVAYKKDLFSRLSVGNKTRLCWLKFKGKHSISNCKRDVQSHYDKGNAFYATWLDEDMNYSCAYFRSENDTLERAQKNKNLHILRKLRLVPGERLLDIGCGWGALLRVAARRFGVDAVGLTLSHEQKALGDERIRQEGLDGKCEIRLQDYREVPRGELGTYDKLVSVGMFEHVGKEKYRVFFKRSYELLKGNGLFLLHTISRLKPQDTDPWICTYIFPGGYIPSIGQVLEAASDAGFKLVDMEDLRRHYALTLGHWLRRFEKARAKVQEMMGEEFVRMWRLYLVGSQVSFTAGDMYVTQFLFQKGHIKGLPLTRDWMHCY